jgi:WD40 repeat protein
MLGGSQINYQLHTPSPIRSAMFTADESALITTGDNEQIRVWDILHCRSLQTLRHTSSIHTIAVSPRRPYRIASTGEDHTILIQQLISDGGRTQRILRHNRGIHALAFHPEGDHLLAICDDGSARIWEGATGREIDHRDHTEAIKAVAWNLEGTAFITISYHGTIKLWKWDSAQKWAKATPMITIKQAYDIHAFACTSCLTCVATASGNTVVVWHTKTGNPIAALQHHAPVTDLAFNASLDGPYLATSSEDGTARIWNVQAGTEFLRIPHAQAVNTVAYSPNGLYLVTGGEDGRAHVWKTTRGGQLARIHHRGNVSSIASCFSPLHGYHVATAGGDGYVQLSHITRTGFGFGERLSHRGRVTALTFSGDGRFLIRSRQRIKVSMEPVRGKRV